jgi:hypothetical protein
VIAVIVPTSEDIVTLITNREQQHHHVSGTFVRYKPIIPLLVLKTMQSAANARYLKMFWQEIKWGSRWQGQERSIKLGA